MMRAVEHRWNGFISGWSRLDVYLGQNADGTWEVELRGWKREISRRFDTEAEARQVADSLTGADTGYAWKNL